MRCDNDIRIPIHQISYKAIWKEELEDFNPVCIYENGDLTHTQIVHFPLTMVIRCKENILKVIESIGAIVAEYGQQLQISPRLEVTAFPIHPKYIFSVEHLFDPLMGTRIVAQHYTFLTLPKIPPQMIKNYRKRSDIDVFEIVKKDIDVDQYEEKYAHLLNDLKQTKLNRICDFALSTIIENKNIEKEMCIVPSIEIVQPGDIVAIIAYHAEVSEEWIQENYEGNQHIPTLDQLRNMFNNFNHKCVSAGIVMETGKYYFTVDCSILPGSSSGPVFKLNISGQIDWIGFVLSGAKGNGSNTCMSVHHPAFVEFYQTIYKEWVLLGYSNKDLEKYIQKHF